MNSSTSAADLRQRLIDGPYGLTPKQADNFIKKVKFGADDECWEWIAGRDSHGYGSFRLNGTLTGAHRISGNVIRGLYALHMCDNPACVNPTHIRGGTQSQNMKDRADRNPQSFVRGARNGRAKLSASEVLAIRKRYRDETVTQQALADVFKCSRGMVGYIVRMQKWSHLADAA